ncbi:hypothetical protein GGR55DRAFT_671455 [Xylaria sp. FL0064]|nr:hypothetical protein GGR55DRAFT_671455 [Xylaria sp. FL0064]
MGPSGFVWRTPMSAWYVDLFHLLACVRCTELVSLRILMRCDNTQIMPLKLRDAITMDWQAKEFANRDGTPRRCHGCGSKAKADLSKCGRCALFCYCNRDCQTNGWQDHKKFCKVLKDENVKKVLMLDFENTDDGVISFS